MLKGELANRWLYGILAAIIGALLVYVGGYVFFGAVIIISLIMSLEFDNLRRDGKVCFMFAVLPILFSYHPEIALALVLIAIISVSLLDMLVKTNNPWLVISIAYIAIPAISTIWLRDQANGLYIVIWLLLVIIATDTGAYFTGKRFGKHLLAPKISPKKTWEGLAGGVICAFIVSVVYTNEITFALLAVVFSVGGQLSDLLESAVKRYFNVKDTGKLLPGHGGFMDRLDGLLLTAPAAAVFKYYGIIPW